MHLSARRVERDHCGEIDQVHGVVDDPERGGETAHRRHEIPAVDQAVDRLAHLQSDVVRVVVGLAADSQLCEHGKLAARQQPDSATAHECGLRVHLVEI